ncbi:hypothetical protein Mic7113_0963 [Allocoleopsis franciscana PCC 7113]|uniref:Uncharacterized protein n=1 Tax=Allocoleopsis franciscana PCC 7113 TaxID=1173027 RepID=K9WAL8_9CYAN|nr:hypothetical protein Mic7113_0963 [Allocoleopsis franciscana PCC 7113]
MPDLSTRCVLKRISKKRLTPQAIGRFDTEYKATRSLSSKYSYLYPEIRVPLPQYIFEILSRLGWAALSTSLINLINLTDSGTLPDCETTVINNIKK